MEIIANGWVETAAWEQFDAWLYDRAPLYQDNSYFDGRGAAMSGKEVAALAEWAETVYATLTQSGSRDDVPAVCPVARAGQQLLLSQANGYCQVTKAVKPDGRLMHQVVVSPAQTGSPKSRTASIP